MAGRRGLADESPWVRQGGDPVFTQQREGRFPSLQPERVPTLRCATLHGNEHLPKGEVCGVRSPGRGPGLEVVYSCYLKS